MRCWMAKRHPYRVALRDAGFVRYDADLHLTYRVWDGDREQLRFMQEPDARIHIMTADTDHV